jgi:hypothetical protein
MLRPVNLVNNNRSILKRDFKHQERQTQLIYQRRKAIFKVAINSKETN